MNVIDGERLKAELAAGLPPRERRLSPELQAIFGPRAQMAGPDDFLRLVGDI